MLCNMKHNLFHGPPRVGDRDYSKELMSCAPLYLYIMTHNIIEMEIHIIIWSTNRPTRA